MTSIFVGNLDFQTTEHDIRCLFETYGTIERISIVVQPDTGQPRGFAFVHMGNDFEAGEAIRGLTGASLGGRVLKILKARPKPDWWQARLSMLEYACSSRSVARRTSKLNQAVRTRSVST